MGSLSSSRLIVLLALFGLTSGLVYHGESSRTTRKPLPLSKALAAIPGWSLVAENSLPGNIVSALKLDDYINATYSDGTHNVSLYIGYYLTSKKVGAAHDPIVCFPGQGWVVSDVDSAKSMRTKSNGTISYSSMVVERGGDKQLIVYWFQSYDKANAGTFLQKIRGFWKKWLGEGEDNAFVRVSVTLDSETTEEAENTAREFIRAFFPRFIRYITNEMSLDSKATGA